MNFMKMKGKDMTIKQHEHAGEILELYYCSLRRKELIKGSINGFAGTFPSLRKKYMHQLEIIKMAELRIYISYKNYILKHL